MPSLPGFFWPSANQDDALEGDGEQAMPPLSRSPTEYFEPGDASHLTGHKIQIMTTPVASELLPKGGSDFFATSGGREMLDLMDSLRSIDKVNTTIPLPQIIVVGQQSSGKSSVLNAISGIPFPTDQDMTTHFPTEIILRRTAHRQTTVSIRQGSNSSQVQKLEDFNNHWKARNFDLNGLPEMIAHASKALGIEEVTSFTDENQTLGSCKTPSFADASLVLEICGPTQENLTLIDLPGLITSTTAKQDSNDITLVENIVEKYMSNERAIILAVFTGTMDFENQKLIQKLKDSPEYMARSMGIITAPDKIDAESLRESRCLDHINNRTLTLRFGWHVLRNLTSREVKENLNRDEVEASFFETQTPWSTEIDKSQVGSSTLKKRLSQVLQSSIAKAIPSIRAQIESALSTCREQLKDLGEERLTSCQQREYLGECGRVFNERITATLTGNPQSGQLDSEEMPLRAHIRMMAQSFCRNMDNKGRTWKVVPEQYGKHDAVQLSSAITDLRMGKDRQTMKVHESDMISWLSDRIWNNQGQAPPNLVDPLWAGTLFREQTMKWRSLAQTYLDAVFEVVKQDVVSIIKNEIFKDASENILRKFVLPEMKQLKVNLDAKLSELCQPYKAQYPQTLSRRYLERLNPMYEDTRTPKLTSPARTTIHDSRRDIIRTVDAYYDICSEIFIDNVQNLAIEHCLLDKIRALAGPGRFEGMRDEELDEIAGELPEVKEKRKRLTSAAEQYKKALDDILDSLEAKVLGQSHTADRKSSSYSYVTRSAKFCDDLDGNVFADSRKERYAEDQQTPAYKLTVPSGEQLALLTPPNSGRSKVRATQAHDPVLVTPPEQRRRSAHEYNIARSREISDDGRSPSPSTIFSAPSERSSTSSVSSYQGSPMPSVKTTGASPNPSQHTITEVSR